MFSSMLIVCAGACIGAVSRWLFNIALNPLFPALPPGTLTVNLLGSLIMGLVMAAIFSYPSISQNWRLFIITGFLGSFTTFSAFSGEMEQLLQQGRYILCGAGICLHVFGSIGMVFLGMFIFNVLKKFSAG